MFAHHRKKIRLLFAAADALLTIAAFEAAYFTRVSLTLERLFFLRLRTHILLVVFCAAVWIALGSLQRVYEYLDSTNPKRLLMNVVRQSVAGTILIVVFQYLLRLDPPLSRSFLFLFFIYDSLLLALFRWSSPYLVGAFQRGFGTPYHLVIVGDEDKASSLARQLCHGSPFRIRSSRDDP